MLSESKLNELALAEEMAYFRADLCIYSPESFALQEKRQICDDSATRSR